MSSIMIPCDITEVRGLERTRFFAQQLVGPDDLTQDQQYFREKARRHNRMLHGWGVVCGARVRIGKVPCELVIEPGYILGPYGDEIVLDRLITYDVCKQGAGELTGCCGDDLDPWCGDVHEDCAEGTRYLAVRYRECLSRPVRAPGGGCGCGCEDDKCEYSRIRDGYAVKLLRELPSSYVPWVPPVYNDLLNPCHEPCGRSCPPCPKEPWVILADVNLGADCRVRSYDCFAHRRHIMSFGTFFMACPPKTLPGVGTWEDPAGTLPGAYHAMMRTELTRLIDRHGMETLDIAEGKQGASDLPVDVLVKEDDAHELRQPVRELSIAEAAAMNQDEFVARALDGVAKKDRQAATVSAVSAWMRARDVIRVISP